MLFIVITFGNNWTEVNSTTTWYTKGLSSPTGTAMRGLHRIDDRPAFIPVRKHTWKKPEFEKRIKKRLAFKDGGWDVFKHARYK